MKRLSLYLLILILVFCCIPAYAVGTSGQGDMVARNGELAAFADGSGNIYVSGLNTPVNTTKAESIISIDPYRILFFAQADAAGRLISLNLNGFGETIITEDAYAACLSGDEIYFISRSNRNQLMRYDFNTQKAQNVLTANEALERVYETGSGVIATLVEGAGAYITDAMSGSFIPYSGEAAAEIALYDDFEAYLTDNHNLYFKQRGALTAVLVDTGVQDWTVIGSTIYYLSGSTDAASLKMYQCETGAWSTILTLPANMQMQLTSSENALFMLSKDNVIYSVDIYAGKLVTFTALPALDSYAMTGGKSVESYRIEAVSGQLNVYGVINDTSVLPTFTFVDFSSQVVSDDSNSISLLSAYAINDEETVWNLLQPAQQYTTLRKGNRGDAVAAIQQPLYDLKYYDYYIDGIFGWRTQLAIELLQADLGLEVNGVADADLQKLILSGNLAAYDPYRGLARGDRGYRVTEMQQRLRDLGYLADSADGIYGSRTQAAVELFQRENGLNVTGSADSKTLRALRADSAKACSSYIDLQRGDSGYRVRELNSQLKKLYYLEGSVGNSYNSATIAAVTRFQQEIGLKQTGKATTAVQQALFAKNAPEYSGYITLKRGDENARVKDMQRRLSELGYYTGKLDAYFGKETQAALRAFQRAAGIKDSGIADPETLKALYRENAPAYNTPEKVSAPVIELSAYSKYENGIYQIADSDTTDGGVTVSWFADGDVASYDVSITDDRNVIYTESKNVNMTIASIPITSLDAQRTYTITVTAHPADTKNDQDAAANIRFVRLAQAADPEPEIGKISSLIVSPDGSDIVREDNVYVLSGDMLSFKWSADGSVSGYVYVIADSNGNQILTSSEISDRLGVNIEAVQLAADEIYTLSVYAIPTNGSISDATLESIRFRRNVPQAPVETAAPELPTQEATEVPTEAPAVTATPEPVVEAIGTPVLSIEPSIGAANMDVPTPEGGSVNADVIHLADGTISFNWTAEGNVSAYTVCITDASGSAKVNQELTSNGATIPSTNLEYGMPYCLDVTAHAADGQSDTSARVYFLLPYPAEAIDTETTAEPEVEATAEPTVEPIAEATAEPVVETTDEITAEPTVEPTVELTEEPTAEPTEEPTEEPTVEPIEEPTPELTEAPTVEPTEEPTVEPTEEPTEEPTVEPTEEPTEEPTVEPTEEPTVEPTEEPTEEPTAEPVPEASYPMDNPGAWQETITASSAAEAIHTIQKRLVEWKWLADGSYSKGTLDEATMQALIAFQNYCNESGMSVHVSDASNPEVHKDSLHLLFNADGISIHNPNA